MTTVFFTNPWGLLGLLGIPTVILIHFFQKRSKRFRVSTMFLVEHWQEDARKGTSFEKLRNTLPLWLQLLAVLLFTLLLTQPRWLNESSAQRVVVVYDTSASMSAFLDEADREVTRLSATLARDAATTEWILLHSHRLGLTSYRGTSRAEMLSAFRQVLPLAGTHDFTDILRDARIAAGQGGRILLVTDRDPGNVGQGVHPLLVGRPIENIGIAGARVERGEAGEPRWLATVRNFGEREHQFTWYLEANGQRNEGTSTSLRPGQVVELRGRFPAESDHVAIVLSHDAYLADNRADLVVPRAKPLTYSLELSRAVPFLERLADILPNSSRTGSGDIDLVLTDRLNLLPPGAAGISFPVPTVEGSGIAVGDLLVERHSLTDGLNFSGLLFRGEPPLPPAEADISVLVWFNRVPLIYLKQESEGAYLVFNFDPEGSNVDRLPATVLLARRFVEEKRARKFAPFTDNFETGQRITGIPYRGDTVFTVTDARGERTTANSALALRAPEWPGLFTITVGGETIVRGAARMADTRESDFRLASTRYPELLTAGSEMEARYEDDFLTPLWLLIIAGLVFASWYYSGRYGV